MVCDYLTKQQVIQYNRINHKKNNKIEIDIVIHLDDCVEDIKLIESN